MKAKLVKDLMVRHPIFISPNTTLREAALKMKEANCGILQVGSPDQLLGIVTDRDIVIRALINGDHTKKPVKGYMTPDIVYCAESDSLEVAAEIMQERKVNRLIVKDDDGRITGLLSFGDTLRHKTSGRKIAKIIKQSLKKNNGLNNVQL